ncbi:MAG TPA: maleylpyruvate isomerase N-terminal domain-containing protein [Candidatus Limnocylindria bacterium]|jgi:hypothetical protein|nr:maleylpyruvate isomerase N-terminal domain-containing protein [Candidatus Limnocylindria bacterium]
MDLQHIQDNATGRQRLRDLVARLDEVAQTRTLDGGWTVSALLAHLACWDVSVRRSLGRRGRSQQRSQFPELARAAGPAHP